MTQQNEKMGRELGIMTDVLLSSTGLNRAERTQMNRTRQSQINTGIVWEKNPKHTLLNVFSKSWYFEKDNKLNQEYQVDSENNLLIKV